MSYGYSQPQYAAYAPPAYAYPPPARRSAPPGVHVIAILHYLSGFGALVTAAIAGYFAYLASQQTPYPSQDIISPEGAARLFGLTAAVIAVVGLITILLGRKLQRGRQWARVLVLVLSALDLASALYAGFVHDTSPRGIVAIVVPVLYLGLLNTPSARSWFRAHTY